VGEGAIRFRDQLDPAEVDVPPDDSLLHRVSAIVLAGLEAAHTGGTGVVPDYLRLPDAEISLRAGAEGDST
jgi:tRNA threonylcarbamoyladenosine biosynthesis protein TsaB